jgi:hypothetical protein
MFLRKKPKCRGGHNDEDDSAKRDENQTETGDSGNNI